MAFSAQASPGPLLLPAPPPDTGGPQPSEPQPLEVVIDELQLGHLLKTVEVLEDAMEALRKQLEAHTAASAAQAQVMRQQIEALTAVVEAQQNQRKVMLAEARGLVRGIMIPVALAGGAIAAGGKWLIDAISMWGR